MNFIVLFVLLGINGAAALRERVVDRQEQAIQRQALSQYPYLTCHDMFGHTFPNDSIRQRDLMIAIGCANGMDTVKVAQVRRETDVDGTWGRQPATLDSLVAQIRQAGAPRDSTKKP